MPVQSKATSVTDYLKELTPERRKTVTAIRKLIKQSLPPGFEEGMQYGMIGYFVPHRLYPNGYHCNPEEPLPYICLASQKNHCSLYLYAQYSCTDENSWFHQAWKATGKKMNMGKSCVRFKKTEDLPLSVIAEAVERLSVEQYIEIYESAIKPKPATQRTTGKRSTASKKTKATSQRKNGRSATKTAESRKKKKKIARKPDNNSG